MSELGNDCAICYEPLNDVNLLCRHNCGGTGRKFHKVCLNKIFDDDSRVSAQCPNCRKPIKKEKVEKEDSLFSLNAKIDKIEKELHSINSNVRFMYGQFTQKFCDIQNGLLKVINFEHERSFAEEKKRIALKKKVSSSDKNLLIVTVILSFVNICIFTKLQ